MVIIIVVVIIAVVIVASLPTAFATFTEPFLEETEALKDLVRALGTVLLVVAVQGISNAVTRLRLTTADLGLLLFLTAGIAVLMTMLAPVTVFAPMTIIGITTSMLTIGQVVAL